jgi:hypothetical protein
MHNIGNDLHIACGIMVDHCVCTMCDQLGPATMCDIYALSSVHKGPAIADCIHAGTSRNSAILKSTLTVLILLYDLAAFVMQSSYCRHD